MQDVRSSPGSAFGRSGRKKRQRGRPRELKIKLKAVERKGMQGLMERGRESVRVLKRAQALRLLDRGWSPEEAAEAVGMTGMGVRKVAERYLENGMKGAIEEPSRPGRERAIQPKEEAHLIAMVCGPAPEGRARWAVRLIAEEAQRRGITKAKRETIRVFMETHALKPWREKNVVRSGVDPGIRGADGGRSQSLRKASLRAGAGGVSG